MQSTEPKTMREIRHKIAKIYPSYPVLIWGWRESPDSFKKQKVNNNILWRYIFHYSKYNLSFSTFFWQRSVSVRICFRYQALNKRNGNKLSSLHQMCRIDGPRGRVALSGISYNHLEQNRDWIADEEEPQHRLSVWSSH